MRRVAMGIGLVLAAGVLFGVSVLLASELGGEVVKLETADAGEAIVATHLWVVDSEGRAWLRAGVPSSGWLQRIEANPRVMLTRDGRSARFLAVPVRDAEARDRIHALMREKYGLADRWISLIRDGSRSVPVRLEPAG